MIRKGNLFQEIIELSNLELAFWKAQRGKSGKHEVQLFRQDLDNNLCQMRNDMQSGNYKMGDYHYFTIYDPKERVICAASFRERVMQHAVINVCEPVFERYQIYDSYACRKKKGVDACLKRCMKFCQNYSWYLKMDIHKFFDTIHHTTLLRMLDRRFKDARVMDYFSQLIDTYSVTPGRGIPIGNLTSQFFANLYLGWLDHLIKDKWNVPGYVRYMDDFILFGDSHEYLQEMQKKVSEVIEQNLQLELNPVVCNLCACGVSFLSYKVRKDNLKLSLKAKRRFRKKIHLVNMEEDAGRALPLLAFVQRAESFGFRWNVLYGD